MKLSVALGLREKLEKSHKNMVDDMSTKFKNKQGLFMGLRKTFEAKSDHPDQPEKRQFQNVSSTVDEQIQWLTKHSEDYLTTVLSIEKTNAQNVCAELVIDGQSWGKYTTLELLRLKGIMDGKLRDMVQNLPIRPETVIWSKTQDPVFSGREIYEAPIEKGETKTTLKRTVIVEDPHIKDSPNRPPVTQPIDTPVVTGSYTTQDFSGAITNRERAEMEVRYDKLYKAIIAALEEANGTEMEQSDLGKKFLNYVF